MIVLYACGLPARAAAQVVPPGATYFQGIEGTSAASAARWKLARDGSRTLRVYLDAPPADDPGFWDQTRQALSVWAASPGIPFRFVVTQTEPADVVFHWIDRFPTMQAGTTDRALERGFIRDVTVLLARSHVDGTPMGPEFRRLVALHEVGHVLGLPHSENPADVMYPGNRQLDPSPRDLRTLRSLYLSESR